MLRHAVRPQEVFPGGLPLMRYYYLLLDLGSLLIPLVFSLAMGFFTKAQWKVLAISTSLVAIPFLIWDAFFTVHGIWGFNPDFHLDILLVELPLEEILFFYCIPFASLFIHFIFERYLPNLGQWNTGQAPVLIAGIILLGIAFWNVDRWYTLIDLGLAGLILVYTSLDPSRRALLMRFLPAFILILVPFFVVNGALTGSFTEEPVVWYNDLENLGIRMWTIPVEDTFYAFSMLFGNLLIFERLSPRVHPSL